MGHCYDESQVNGQTHCHQNQKFWPRDEDNFVQARLYRRLIWQYGIVNPVAVPK